MQPADINRPIYKVIVGMVAMASLLNLWLLQALTQHHCAQLDLRLVKISLGTCPIAEQSRDLIMAQPFGAARSIFKINEHHSHN